jgi:outer membrane protein assembly factor BamB
MQSSIDRFVFSRHCLAAVFIAAAISHGIGDISNAVEAISPTINWPQFRGPNGDGVGFGAELPEKFDENTNVAWRTPIHGKAWSSPVIWGSEIWLSTANEAGTELGVVTVDKENGEILRDQVLFQIDEPQFCHKFNSYASPTPVIEEGRVYVTFGSPGTACLDTKTGAKLWERTDFVCNHFRAAGSSPILFHNLLIMNFDGSDHQFVVALNKLTGETVWETQRSVDFQDLDETGKPKAEGDYRKGFSTPHIVDLDGQSILISSGAKSHYAYDAMSGKELWRFDDLTSHSPCTRPVIGHGLAFIPTGHGKAGLIAVKLGSSGTLKENDIAWRMTRAYPNKPSVTLHGDLLFVVEDKGIATCLDAKSGDKIWQERLGGNFSSSPVLVNGKFYAGNEEGRFFVFEAGREFKLLGDNEFADGFMASPVLSDSALYLRSKSMLYRIQNK